jgi:hypothetical protein
MPPLDYRTRPREAFPGWSLQTAQSAVYVPAWVRENLAYYGGDHWRGGNGWGGPHPDPLERDAARAWAEIARAFTSENVLKEIADRRANGVIGREPMWSYVPRFPVNADGEASQADQRLIDELTDFVTPWWDERGVHEDLQHFASTFLVGERAPMRIGVPSGLMQSVTLAGGVVGRGVPRLADIPAALDMIYLDALGHEDGTVYAHPDTRQRAGVYLYRVGDQDRAEVSWVDRPSGRTVIRDLGGSSLSAPLIGLALGGRLPVYEVTHRRFITAQILQIQRALNLALTMLPHNIVTGGFLEMVITGGMMPGHFEPDPSNPSGPGTWVPHELTRGASMTQWISGQHIGTDAQGRDQYTTPGVHFRPPSPVTPVVEAGDALYERMLRAANQIHVLMSSDGEASGIARQIARAEFVGTLRSPRERVQRAGRWILESVAAWAELLVGDPGRYTNRLRCDFTCMLDEGPLSVEERAQNAAEVEAGTLSDETAMERAGVEDVRAELGRIRESDRGLLNTSKRRAEAVQLWLDAGLTFRGACKAAGIPDDEAAALARMLADEPDPNDPANPNNPGTRPAPAAE